MCKFFNCLAIAGILDFPFCNQTCKLGKTMRIKLNEHLNDYAIVFIHQNKHAFMSIFHKINILFLGFVVTTERK